MAGSNLPPGVTPQDIDDHFGGDPDEAYVTLNVTVDVKAAGYDNNQLIKDAKETVRNALRGLDGDVIEADVVHIEER